MLLTSSKRRRRCEGRRFITNGETDGVETIFFIGFHIPRHAYWKKRGNETTEIHWLERGIRGRDED
jgi:hypothetical protein